jgi:hypothetical protein
MSILRTPNPKERTAKKEGFFSAAVALSEIHPAHRKHHKPSLVHNGFSKSAQTAQSCTKKTHHQSNVVNLS